MIGPLPFSVFLNPRAGVPGVVVLPQSGFRRAKAAITRWPGYAPTPLRDLPSIARETRVAAVRLKDETGRFGLGSFKALGGAYGVPEALSAARVRGDPAGQTVTCATDGNHGRAVAWGAARLGCRCVVFLHERVSPAREAAIARLGAEIRRVAGRYDDAVRTCTRTAEREGWIVVSDTSWPGYLEIPRSIMQGYRLMAEEVLDQWSGPAPTHVFVQGGVGGMAAAVSAHLRSGLPDPPALIIAEPDRAACLLASAELGALTAVPGALDTVMAGLACAEPSLLAWQELDRAACAFMAIPDEAVAPSIRVLADLGTVVGESGVAGLAAFLLAADDPAARESLGILPESRVLLFATEGTTDKAQHPTLVRN